MPIIKKAFLQVYPAMLKELARTHLETLSESEFASNCFWITITYWEKIKKKFLQQTNPDEIFFFKSVKPSFHSYIQFYTLLAEAFLFVPLNLEKQLEFWEEEQLRVKWFMENHAGFAEYIFSGSVENDELFFTRLPANYPTDELIFSYDNDLRSCSSKDRLLSQLFAYQRFEKFCQRKIKLIARQLKKQQDED